MVGTVRQVQLVILRKYCRTSTICGDIYRLYNNSFWVFPIRFCISMLVYLRVSCNSYRSIQPLFYCQSDLAAQPRLNHVSSRSCRAWKVRAGRWNGTRHQQTNDYSGIKSTVSVSLDLDLECWVDLTSPRGVTFADKPFAYVLWTILSTIISR